MTALEVLRFFSLRGDTTCQHCCTTVGLRIHSLDDGKEISTRHIEMMAYVIIQAMSCLLHLGLPTRGDENEDEIG